MLFFIYFLCGLVGFVVGAFIVFLYMSSKRNSSLKIKIERDQMEKEQKALKEENLSYKQQIIPLSEDCASLKSQNEARLKELENQKQLYKEKLTEKEMHFKNEIDLKTKHYEEKLTDQEKSFQEQKERDQKHFAEKEKHFQQLAEKTKAEFENTAKKIFLENTKSYREESSKDLSQILKPFKEDIEGFKKSVQGFESKGKFLDETISNFKDINLKMRDEAKKLSQTLKGDVKAQGQWGEFVLKNILEKSGLREGEEFFVQGQGLSLKDEKGASARPDVVVKLPDKKHIIIDSKVSVTHFQGYFSSETEKEREENKQKIFRSVSKHIEDLANKKYHLSEGLRSPDFTLMFIPNEGAFAFVTQEHDFFEKAWRHSIVLVSPTTLYAVLKTVASIWKVEAYNKNAEEIARQGGRLYDKFVGFLEDMGKVDLGLKKARESYDSAKGKLNSGRGNLIRSVEKLRNLKVRNEKQIPSSFTEE